MNKKIKSITSSGKNNNESINNNNINKSNSEKPKPTIIQYQNVNFKIQIKKPQNPTVEQISKNKGNSSSNNLNNSNVTGAITVKDKIRLKKKSLEGNSKKHQRHKEKKKKRNSTSLHSFDKSNKKNGITEKPMKIKNVSKLVDRGSIQKESKKLKIAERNSKIANGNYVQIKSKESCDSTLHDMNDVETKAAKIENNPQFPHTSNIVHRSKNIRGKTELPNVKCIKRKSREIKNSFKLSTTNNAKDESIKSSSQWSSINGVSNRAKKLKSNSQLSCTNGVSSNGKIKLKSMKRQKLEHDVKKIDIVIKKKMKKEKKFEYLSPSMEASNTSKKSTRVSTLDIKRLEKMLAAKKEQLEKASKKIESKPVSLKDQMMDKLRASRFRYLNEILYNSESSETKKYFKDDPDAFIAYHEGYKQQVGQWSLKPLDIIISSIKKMPENYIIADFGCGEARLATSLTQKVCSFDFVSLNENVTVCDMAHTPLLRNGVHVVVFCLSLMGTNLNDYIAEANRVLKQDGILKIAEVESRFENVDDFINILGAYGFKNTSKDLSHNLFCFLDFKKEKDIKTQRSKLPPITLKPCLYKKR